MAIQLSATVRNARLDAIETAIGASAVLKIRSGAQPANVAAADSGTVLATLTLPADYMAAASGGSKAKVAEAKQALEAVKVAQIRAKEREATAKALDALAERYDATLAALQQAEANERAWIRRLQDEDDFFLLAA